MRAYSPVTTLPRASLASETARMVAVPSATAVTLPLRSTVATWGSLELQTTFWFPAEPRV